MKEKFDVLVSKLRTLMTEALDEKKASALKAASAPKKTPARKKARTRNTRHVRYEDNSDASSHTDIDDEPDDDVAKSQYLF
jgi:hypothetical protein